MEIFKLEIHTNETKFPAFRALQEYDFEIIAGIPLHTHVGTQVQDDFLLAGSRKYADEGIKMELFTSMQPVETKDLLAKLGLTTTVRFQSCSPLQLTFDEQSTEQKSHEEENVEKSPERKSNTSSVSCTVKRLTSESMRIQAEAPSSCTFLPRIFTFLHDHEVEIFSGRKFRQGERDFITCTVSSIPEPLIDQFQDQLSNALQDVHYQFVTKQNNEYGSVNDSLDISLQASGSLSALRISCLADFAFVRPYLCQLLTRQGIDISLARLSNKQGKIEDVYHFKPADHDPSATELTKALLNEVNRKVR